MANEYFKKEIAELKAQGITLADLTADEVAELVKSCEKMAHPFSLVNSELAGFPLRLSDGNILHRLTIGASVWLDEYAGQWFDAKSKRYFWSVVYALGHARDRDAFIKLTTEPEAKKAIVRYSMTLGVTEAELVAAIETLVGGNDKSVVNVGDTNWGELIRELEVVSGIAADIWIWERAADWVVKAYNAHRVLIKNAAGEHAPRMKDELDRATNNLARLRCAIINRVKAEKENAQ